MKDVCWITPSLSLFASQAAFFLFMETYCIALHRRWDIIIHGRAPFELVKVV
jgi:hypothetical protein